jgi:hypothetical protein
LTYCLQTAYVYMINQGGDAKVYWGAAETFLKTQAPMQ